MAERHPFHPWLVLAVALVLPGCGQVMNRQPQRGLVFLFFTLLLGSFTLLTADPGVSVVGKLAGGLFVYAMAIFDAYRTARLRWEIWQNDTRGAARPEPPPSGAAARSIGHGRPDDRLV